MTNQSFLRNELLDLQVRADELDTENIKLGKENEKYEIENKKLRSTISELTSQLCNTVERKDFEDLTNKYENLEEKFESLDKTLKRMKKENDTLNNSYVHCQSNYSQLEAKCETYKKENVELKSNMDELKGICKQTLKDATAKSQEVEEQQKIISVLQEENDSIKAHLNYLKEQNKKNVSILSCGGDSFSFEKFDSSNSVPESMDIIVETKLRDCQKRLEEAEAKLADREDELHNRREQFVKYQTDLESLKAELDTVEQQKTELEDHLESELNKKHIELTGLNQQLAKMNEDYVTLNANLSAKERELQSTVEELDKFRQANNENQQRIENLTDQLHQLGEQLKLNEEERSKLAMELEAVRERGVEEQSRLKENLNEEMNELINKHQAELEVINLQQEQKLSTLTAELSKQEEEELQIRAQIDELKSRNSELQSNYDQLVNERDELKRLNEVKDSKLIDLESENEKQNLDLNKISEEIAYLHERLNETEISSISQSALTELASEKEAILIERNELEKQVKELKSALSQARDEFSLLAKKHQEEIFKLSETMNKKQDDDKLRSDVQNVIKELKSKEDQLTQLRAEIEKRTELTQKHLIQIEKLKANEREKNHMVYMLKQRLNEQEIKFNNDEVEKKRLEAELKCAEDSFALERKTKERYYRDLTELEKRRSSCEQCTKLERSNSLTCNLRDQTLLIRNASNPQLIQKIPNPNKYMMEDEEGQFMSSTYINEVRKRKTEHNDQEDFNKRLNILAQRNAMNKPHLRTSYALEFQELGTKHLNEKIKNSEKFVVDENASRNPSMLNKFSSSLRFRKA